MIAKRIGSIVVAVGLIIGAIALRHSIANSDSSTSSSANTVPSFNAKRSVICSTEFASICGQLDSSVNVTIESSGVTLDRLAKASTNELPAAWLTLDPFPAMLDDTRTRAGLSTATRDTTVIGLTDPNLVMLVDRATSFQAACGAAAAWRCIGEFAGTAWSDHQGQPAWGTVKAGVADPALEASGLVQFANAVSGYFNSTDFDRNTWETDPKFSSWLRNLTTNTLVSAASSTPLSTLLVRQSALNIAATSQAEVAQVPNSNATKIIAVAVTPSIEWSAVLTRFTSIDSVLTTKLFKLFQTLSGWRAPAGAKAHLPAGTFIALRQLWKDAT